jgi:hypothetical protein
MTSEEFYAIASIVVALFAGAAILIPILALSARFALKPVMETWTRFRQSETTDQDKLLQDRRIALLEAEVQNLHQLVQQRLEAHEFERKLSAPVSDADAKLPPE